MNYKMVLFAVAILLSSGSHAQKKTEDIPTRSKRLYALPAEKYVREDTYSLPWQRLNKDSVLWKKTVWRIVDAADARNAVFGAGSGKKQLIEVLLEGIFSGGITAYDREDDRCLRSLVVDDLRPLLKPNGRIEDARTLGVHKYRLREQWLFLRNGKLIVRLQAIAPMRRVAIDNAALDMPIFWIDFSESRNYLSTVMTTRSESWDQLLEKRDFESTIIDVSERQDIE